MSVAINNISLSIAISANVDYFHINSNKHLSGLYTFFKVFHAYELQFIWFY